MKVILFPCVLAFTFSGCHPDNSLTQRDTSVQVQKLKDIAGKDSSMLLMSNREDSELSICLVNMNEIGKDLEEINSYESDLERLSADKKPVDKSLLASELDELDRAIVGAFRKLYILQNKLKGSILNNPDMQSLTAHFSRELNTKKKEVILLQSKLCKADASLQPMVDQFNDSLLKLKSTKSLEVLMSNGLNTAYFVSGTLKELQNKGILTSEGKFSGIGKAYETTAGLNNSFYTKTDLTDLKGVGLKGKFAGLVTAHPRNSYEVISTGKTDSISITNPFAFWCESKYLVVAVK